MRARAGTARDRHIARALEAWFPGAARDLPWRRPPRRPTGGARRDPYRSLVSEFMLQQTQVSRVLEKFGPFMRRFPTLARLARADEDEVLAMWSGLGYYRRARLLHAAAGRVVERHGGRVPDSPEDLLALPGVGRYTAGAIASIVFGRRAAAVDGNISRVLLRIEGRESDETAAEREAWVWRRAERLVGVCADPGVLNEGLMELGAVVCTPAAPRCGECPLGACCRARAKDAVDRIPPPKRPAARSDLFCASVVARDRAGRVLMVQRPRGGLWGGLWQCPTIERPDRPPTAAEIARSLGLLGLQRLGRFRHDTTHRRVTFEVWRGRITGRGGPSGRAGAAVWVQGGDLASLGLSNAQRRVLRVAGAEGGAASGERGGRRGRDRVPSSVRP